MKTHRPIIFFFQRTLINPLLLLLKQGITAEKLALTVALGVSLGIFPVIGSTTLLCTVFAIVFKLNLPAIQLVNYFTSPLQLLFLIPFFRMGEFLFQSSPVHFSVLEIIGMIRINVGEAIQTLWWTTLHAIVAWILVGPVLAAALYLLFLLVFRNLSPKTDPGLGATVENKY